MKSDVGVPYPYVRLLAHFDTRELMGVLSLAFRDPAIEGGLAGPGARPGT